MSGGPLNHAYRHVEDAVAAVRAEASRPEHAAFADHLEKVAKALHDLKWMHSSPGNELEAIMSVIQPHDVAASVAVELRRVIDHAAAAAELLVPVTLPAMEICIEAGDERDLRVSVRGQLDLKPGCPERREAVIDLGHLDLGELRGFIGALTARYNARVEKIERMGVEILKPLPAIPVSKESS